MEDRDVRSEEVEGWCQQLQLELSSGKILCLKTYLKNSYSTNIHNLYDHIDYNQTEETMFY